MMGEIPGLGGYGYGWAVTSRLAAVGCTEMQSGRKIVWKSCQSEGKSQIDSQSASQTQKLLFLYFFFLLSSYL